MTLEIDHKQRIDDLVSNNRVFVFMYGTPESPLKEGDRKVLRLLKKYSVEFQFLDVHEDEAMIQALTDYVGVHAMPAVFVENEFIGGPIIMQEMEENGTLEIVLG